MPQKKVPPGGPPLDAINPEIQEQLRSLVGNLIANGASQWIAKIRRRRHGVDHLWQWFKQSIPLDQVDDISEYCYAAGGKEYEYRITILNLNGERPVVGKKAMGDFILPALESPADDVKVGEAGKLDPLLANRQHELREKRLEYELERQEADLERKRRQLEKVKAGEGDDDDEEGDGQIPPGYAYHPQYGLIPAPGMHMGMGGYNPYAPPWMQGGRQDKSELATLLPIVMQGLERIADKVGGGKTSSALDDFVKMKQAGLMPETLQPGDMLGMVSPLVAEMGKISASSSKVLMESIAETDRAFREKMLDMMIASGASDDDIDKWRKILGLVTDTAGQALKLVWGPRGVVRGKDGVKVPVIAGKPQPPGIAHKDSKGKAPTPSESDEAVKRDPAAEAKAVQQERVRVFLLAQEQEMLVGSDAPWAADKLDDIWCALPGPLRENIVAAEVGRIYELLREYEAEVVDRILEAVKSDKTEAHMKWCMDFWTTIKVPPDDGGPDEGEDPGEEGSPQDPAPDGGSEKKPEEEPVEAS